MVCTVCSFENPVGISEPSCNVKALKEMYVYYPMEVRRGEYWGLGLFLLQYFPLVKV